MSDDPKTPERESDREIAEEPADSLEDLEAFADSLRAAHAPTAIDPDEHEKIIARTIAAAPKKETRGRVIRIAFGVTTTLALAAAILFFVTRPKPQEELTASLVRSRSTASLFTAPFKAGDGAARIDRIAMARESDFRENRFAMSPHREAHGRAR